MKKCVVLQVNYAVVRIKLNVFVSKVQLFYVQFQIRLEGRRERGDGCHPSELLGRLTVIWSEASTDSLGGRPTSGPQWVQE